MTTNERLAIRTEYNDSDWEASAPFIEGREVEYIFEAFNGQTKEEQWDEEHRASKSMFLMAWSVASRVQEKVDLLDEGAKQTLIENRAYFKGVREEFISHLHYLEDNIDNEEDKMRLLVLLERTVHRCRVLLADSKKLLTSGHSWSGVAALKNNALSIAENLGEEIPGHAWVRFNGRLIDHEYTNPRQDRDGDDWRTEIRTSFYGMDD
jgi:hypothetical protein